MNQRTIDSEYQEIEKGCGRVPYRRGKCYIFTFELPEYWVLTARGIHHPECPAFGLKN